MSKKFDPSLMQRGKSLSDVAKQIDNIKEETKEAILLADENPTKENIMTAVNILEKDTAIDQKSRDELLGKLKDDYFSLFSFNNCPDDYHSLKSEAKFLAGMTQVSFILMAQRLLKIRDGELYKIDGYPDFKSFIEGELKVAKRTVYDYIDIISCFGVRLTALEENIEYSKLSPVIPLLKADNPDIPKEDLKSKFLKEIKIKSQRELRAEAKELKIKYGLINEKEVNDVHKIYKFLKLNMPSNLNEVEKKTVNEMIEFLKRFSE